jgi:hypothetical protein
MKFKRLEIFLEFLIFGVIVGVIEDIIALKFATGEPITPKVIGIVVLVAIPFAFLGEVVVDKIDFVEIFEKLFKKRKKSPDIIDSGR